MAETVGELLLSAAGAAGVAGVAGFPLASTTVAGIGLTTIVGTTAILGTPVGLLRPIRSAGDDIDYNDQAGKGDNSRY